MAQLIVRHVDEAVVRAEGDRKNLFYLGPAILASIAGNAIYGVMFRTTAINTGGAFTNLMLTLVGAVTAWRMTDTFGRIAWAVFTLYGGTLTAFWGTRIGSFWTLGLVGAFAVLAIGSGSRNASRRAVLIAVGIFLATTVAVFGLRYLSDGLLGNHSVMR